MIGFILAAGFGTRLWPLTEDRTKPAVPLMGKPLICYSVDYLAGLGIKDLVVNLHHQPDSIRSVLGDGAQSGVSVQYSEEPEIRGTSGALDLVRERLSNDDFVVMNGKVVTTIDLSAAIRRHRETAALATLVLKPNRHRERFSTVTVDANGSILGFGAAPEAVQTDSADACPLMFTGIQILSPRVFEYVPRGVFSHSTVHVYPRAISAGERVVAWITDEPWYETSTLERYMSASIGFMRERGLSLVQGKRCLISGASIEESVLWDSVSVGRGASIVNSVLCDNVQIPAGARICRSAVVPRGVVKEIQNGEIVGDNLIVPIDAETGQKA